MKHTDFSRKEWNQFQYNHKMTELENFLVRMIVKFYDTDPSNAEDAFSGLYNHLCVEWLTSAIASEAGVDFDLDVFDYEAFQDECAQGQDLLDQQSISDAYEEMQELDPRDYDRVDDFGDPTT